VHQKLRSHLTFANVVSMIALFVALGGVGAYASHETIFSDDIVDGEVKTADLGNSAVTSLKIANLAVMNPDLGASAVSSGKIATGAVTNTKLGTDAVTGQKVMNESLSGNDISHGTLTRADIGKSTGEFDVDFPNISPDFCFRTGTHSASGTLPGDTIIANVRGSTWPVGVLTQPYVATDSFFVDFCNVTAFDIDPPPTTVRWLIMR
jgi:hypothetical protein